MADLLECNESVINEFILLPRERRIEAFNTIHSELYHDNVIDNYKEFILDLINKTINTYELEMALLPIPIPMGIHEIMNHGLDHRKSEETIRKIMETRIARGSKNRPKSRMIQ